MPSQSCMQFILDPELADAINVNRIAVFDGSECPIYRLLLTNLSVSSQCRTSSAVLSLRSQRDPALPFCPSSSTPVPALPGSDELASYCFKALVSVCVCVRLVHAEHLCSLCRNLPLWLTAYQCISNR